MAKEEKYGVRTIHENKKGLKFEIIEKINMKLRKVKFLDSGYENIVSISSISSKAVKDYSHCIKNGEVYKTKEGYNLIVHDYVDFRNIWVKFEDHESYVFKTTGKNLREGVISNPFHKSVCGVGCYGVGKYLAKVENKNTIEYQSWRDMLRRCYNDKVKEKQTSYKGVTVCDEWLNFQNYALWFDKNKPNINKRK